MAYFFGLIIAALGISVVFTFLNYVRMRIALAKQYRKATDNFFLAVKPLVADDETPTEILRMIDVLNKSIADRRSARMLASFLADSRWRQTRPNEMNKIRVEFFHRRPELERPFHDAVNNWFLAVTALSPFFGKIVRFAMDERNVERAVSTASARTVAKQHRDNNHDACPPEYRAAGV
jgi:hypothetical protein